MSEENKVVFCTWCGSENPGSAKFCSNCGRKLEAAAAQESETVQEGAGVFSGSAMQQPVYEKVEAEILKENGAKEAAFVPDVTSDAVVQDIMPSESQSVPIEQEINISYEAEDTIAASAYKTPEPQYYSAQPSAPGTSGSNGNVGFAIASMICGIFSLLCCCFTFFSVVLGIGALVLGIVAVKNNYEGKGMAIAGIVTGGIGIALSLIAIIIGGVSGMITGAAESFY